MKLKIRIIVCASILLVSFLLITLVNIPPVNVNPAQSTETKKAAILPGLGKGFVLVQKVKSVKDYLTGIEVIFTHAGRNNTNENVLLFLDTAYNILNRETFYSSVLKEGEYHHFDFKKPAFIGKGNYFIMALFSPDGREDNCAMPLMNMNDSTGLFTGVALNADDIVGSIKKAGFPFPGNLEYRTYESNYSQHWIGKIYLCILSLLIAALVLWYDKISRVLATRTIRIEYLYLAISLVFATVFAVITPPYSVPDEGTHFKLSYNLSELGILRKDRTYPASIAKMDTTFNYLAFVAGNKTSASQILKEFEVKTEPETRYPILANDYSLPYLPQAIGIFIGRLFSSHLLYPFYLGRLFNLVLCSFLIFFSIKLIPSPFRPFMVLLALMPKTIFLLGSLSYDSLTIGLSFFSIALFLYYAYSFEGNIGYKELIIMGLTVLLLLLIKPPYFLIGALFFLIPPKKFGKMYRYILVGLGVTILAIFFLKGIPVINDYRTRLDKVSASGVFTREGTPMNDPNMPLFRPDEQLKNIVVNFSGYLDLVFKSGFDYYREYLLKSFVGVLGYIDVELPDLLTYSYLWLILFVAASVSRSNIRIGIQRKILFAGLLIIAYFAIETAMYLFATRPGRDRVFGVQGRYFIPLAPLFLMLFYNRWISPALNILVSRRRTEYRNAKPKQKQAIRDEIILGENLYEKYISVFILVYCIFALVYAVYCTHARYYL